MPFGIAEGLERVPVAEVAEGDGLHAGQPCPRGRGCSAGQARGPLRSAEPAEPSAVLPSDPAADPELTARLNRHTHASAEFRARLPERQGVLIPAEDPDYGYEGEAWLSPWESWSRDAVLKPPKPEIRPAEPVLERAAEFEAGQ